MAKSWDPRSCNEKSGFLFSHECYLAPAGSCTQCQKPVCRDHSHELVDRAGEVLCTSCAKKDRKRHRRGGTGKGTSRLDQHDYDEPYFYGGYYYGTVYYESHHGASSADPNDFTEADAESLSSEMDEGFETDMSES